MSTYFVYALEYARLDTEGIGFRPISSLDCGHFSSSFINSVSYRTGSVSSRMKWLATLRFANVPNANEPARKSAMTP